MLSEMKHIIEQCNAHATRMQFQQMYAQTASMAEHRNACAALAAYTSCVHKTTIEHCTHVCGQQPAAIVRRPPGARRVVANAACSC